MAADPYKYFRIEGAELLERLLQGTLALGKGADDAEQIAALFRFAHTLKGAARIVRLLDVSQAAHRIEDLLTPYRDSGQKPAETCIANILAELDRIGLGLRAIDNQAPALPPATAASPLKLAPPAELRSREAERSVRVELRELEEVGSGLALAMTELETLKRRIAEVALVRERVSTRTNGAARRVRPDEIARTLQRIEREVTEQAERVARELTGVLATAEQLRLVDVNVLMLTLERTVREAALELGRDVEFVGNGGNVRLDANVFDGLLGALVHIVRNSVIHGIESPAERRQVGKPTRGQVRVTVASEGRRILVVCEDDGRGLDFAQIREALRARGTDVSTMSDEQLVTRLLGGGVSTAAQVTVLAGRGVGLDVVRDSVARLGGTLAVAARPRVGLQLRISTPVAATVMETLAVQSGEQTAHLPARAILRSRKFCSDDMTLSSGGATLVDAGEALPLASLAKALGREENRTFERAAVIVQTARGRVALAVERLIGTTTKLLRPLPPLALSSPVVFAAVLDPHGNPELVLDPEALVVEANDQRLSRAEVREPLPILVIDDSLTTRMLEQSILETAGYRVELATSAEEGLVKARQRHFGVFLVDVEMPGMDGFEFVRLTRADPVLCRTPAVLVSSRSAQADFERGKAVGAASYVVKDRFDQREVLALIRRLLEAS